MHPVAPPQFKRFALLALAAISSAQIFAQGGPASSAAEPDPPASTTPPSVSDEEAAPAATARPANIIRSIPHQRLASLLDRLELDWEQVDETSYLVPLGDHEVIIYSSGTALQFYSCFVGSRSTLDKVNAWNMEERYTRAYLDREGDPVLELDLDLSGGSSPRAVITAIERFTAALDRFVKEVLR